MKVLGKSEDGGIIVHLNYDEAVSLEALQESLDGQVWEARFGGDPRLRDREMDKAFVAIRHFVRANFAINNLARVIDELKLVVNGES